MELKLFVTCVPLRRILQKHIVGDLIRSVSQHKNLGEDTTSLLVFGNGDGGGGPLAEMLEKLRRCRGC